MLDDYLSHCFGCDVLTPSSFINTSLSATDDVSYYGSTLNLFYHESLLNPLFNQEQLLNYSECADSFFEKESPSNSPKVIAQNVFQTLPQSFEFNNSYPVFLPNWNNYNREINLGTTNHKLVNSPSPSISLENIYNDSRQDDQWAVNILTTAKNHFHDTDLPKRKRIKYSKDQVDELEREFKLSRSPNVHTIDRLAECLNVQSKNIKIWFKNRKAKQRLVERNNQLKCR
ncbi:hypothetical protein GJ496_006360 [Pomphorhynchus laevis]|nr:hypothetical protein GJ496_006360 [Pomphorhynchus laevis]